MKASIAIVIGYVFLLFLNSNNFFFDSAMETASSWYSEDVTVSKNYVEMLQSRDFDGIKGKLDPAINIDHADEILAKMAGFFPTDKPVSITTTGIIHSITGGSPTITTTKAAFEYEFPDRWIEVELFLKDSGDDHAILGFNAQKTSVSLKERYAFNWYGKNITNYIFLAITCAISIITVTALILCVRSADVKRKWLWIVFILVGFVLVSLNWNDNIVGIQLVAVHFPNAGFGRPSPYGPTTIFASIPLGAILFLLRGKIRRS